MKFVRVDMSKLEVSVGDVPQQYLPMGGRGLTSHFINDEVPATAHPLGKNNKLIFAPGLLSGTRAASSGRLSVGGLSPLTKGIKESNAGGTASQRLARLGIKALVLEGLPEKNDEWYVVKVSKDDVVIEAADKDLITLGNYAVGDKLRAKYGEKVTVISVGPAGEFSLLGASIAVTDTDGRPVRHAGRGGLGAVMGSKRVKAIVIDDAGAEELPLVDPEAFKEASKKFSKAVLDHPVSGEALRNYGTAVLINILNEAGGLPTKNFKFGRFATANKISGETMADIIKARNGKPSHACHPGCIMGCSQVYNDEKGEYLTAGFEYETVWAFGSNCEIDNIDAIAMLDRLCDDIGVDTIEMGVTVAVAMEAGVIPFGDHQAAIKLLEEVKQGTPLGRIIGSGAEITGQVYGVRRVPTVKRQGMPAYDPRAVKGVGVTYATSTMGADHTAGYSVTANILKVGGEVNPLKPENQAKLSQDLQIATAAVDATGLCLFVAFAVLDNPAALEGIIEMLNAQYGLTLTADDVIALGKSILTVEREFNVKAGFTNAHDRLPEYFMDEELEPHHVKFDVPDSELDSIFDFEAFTKAEDAS
ncbi:MAG: aldehyde ferredoxin oxidoreductase C-terminal domain-containing protein [Bacillota bacterium]|nr:aldehyde ferredoxin oxidoreductase C-terminal domain-containing protein [Bacillota bacterium]